MVQDLSNKIFWANHLGNPYLVIDFSGLDDFDTFQLVVKMNSFIKYVARKSIKVLIDLRETDLSFNTHATLRRFAKENQPYIRKSCIIAEGEGIPQLFALYKAVTNSKAQLFSDRSDGLNYLFEHQLA